MPKKKREASEEAIFENNKCFITDFCKTFKYGPLYSSINRLMDILRQNLVEISSLLPERGNSHKFHSNLSYISQISFLTNTCLVSARLCEGAYLIAYLTTREND
jgi:hypothetical protein